MFSFFKKKPPVPPVVPTPASPAAIAPEAAPAVPAPTGAAASGHGAPAATEARGGWLGRLAQGLRKTGSSIAQVFTGARIDDALYEELESALLMADAGVAATEFLLTDLKRRVKAAGATEPAAVKALLADALTDLLRPLEQALAIGQVTPPGPTVIMVTGVNGAGKTTSIGKLTRHLAEADCKVLLAAADTRACDVVIADTAGRLPTQTHRMEELKKIQRTIAKAQPGAPHEVLLVVDGNTGQNALAQVKAFDAALGLTGLIVTKLDGTAKGGVLAAIARWGADQGRVVPVYFIGIGERMEDLQTFQAREFATALLG